MPKRKPITLQTLVDKAYQQFVIQDNPPATYMENSRYFCCYLTEDGRKCAVGLSLPQDHEAQTSRKTFSEIVSEYPTLFSSSIRKMRATSLDNIQAKLHDELIDNFTGKWKCNQKERKQLYLKIYQKFKLKLPIDNQLQ